MTIDTPQNLEGLQAMQQLIDAKATQPDPGATDRTPLIDVFIQGKIGMIEGLPPTVGQINEKNPGLTYAIAPIPTKDGTPSTLGVADHLMAFKNDGDKAEAIKKFLDYFYSEDVYVSWVEAEGFLPVTKSGAEALSAKPELKTFLDVLPTAKFYPATNPKWSATQGAFQSLVGQIGQGSRPGGRAAADPGGGRRPADRVRRTCPHRDRRTRRIGDPYDAPDRPRAGADCWPPLPWLAAALLLIVGVVLFPAGYMILTPPGTSPRSAWTGAAPGWRTSSGCSRCRAAQGAAQLRGLGGRRRAAHRADLAGARPVPEQGVPRPPLGPAGGHRAVGGAAS